LRKVKGKGKEAKGNRQRAKGKGQQANIKTLKRPKGKRQKSKGLSNFWNYLLYKGKWQAPLKIQVAINHSNIVLAYRWK